MKNKNPSGNYFLLSNDIFDEELSARAFYVFAYLKKCSNKDRLCFPSRKDIAKNCHCDVKTVDSALDDLESAGLITISPRYNSLGQTSNLYEICEMY